MASAADIVGLCLLPLLTGGALAAAHGLGSWTALAFLRKAFPPVALQRAEDGGRGQTLRPLTS